MKKQTSGETLSRAAQDYMDAHWNEKFSLENMAKALYVNRCYLVRAFRRCTGMTPLYYHHRVRCAKAKELLADTELTVSQVGEAVGFVSSSHFSHIFRETEGCTPSEYRKASQSDDLKKGQCHEQNA